MTSFAPNDLERLRQIPEVRVETQRGPGSPVHRTIVWVVVDDADRVMVRSEYADAGRWYREALANPDCALLFDDRRIPVTAEHASDPDRVAAYSRAVKAKYRPGASVQAMVRDEVLDATLELHPRAEAG